MKRRQGEWKRAAQDCAEKQATTTAQTVWLAYWKKYDRQRRQEQKPKR